jgi:fucokinase
VEEIIAKIKPFTSAVSRAGAGGGGFMYILAKSAADAGRIRALLEKDSPSRYSKFYSFDVDPEGLVIEKV